MKTIQLTQGYIAIVDDEDYEKLSKKNWCISGHSPWLYAYRKGGERMHRSIMNAPKDMQVDHINGNTLDNRKKNLRICSLAENCRNVRTQRNLPKGVHKKRNKFRARIKINGTLQSLGYFKTPEEAARAYDEAAFKTWGEFACLNNL